MKNFYQTTSVIFLLLIFVYPQHILAQTTETFESYTSGKPTTFTSNSQSFTISASNCQNSAGGLFGIFIPGQNYQDCQGINRTSTGGGYGVGTGCASASACGGSSNKFIENSPSTGVNQVYSIKTTNSASFTIKSIYVYVSTNQGASHSTTAGVTFRGKKAGSVSFTLNPTLTGNSNGFTFVDFVTAGYGGVNIDELEIQGGAAVNYVALDNFRWDVAAATTTINSIVRVASTPTNQSSITYTTTFGASVTGVTTSRFSLSTTGSISGASVAGVTGSGTTYTVTVNTGSGSGTIGLNLNNATGISPGISTTLPFAGETYTVDKTAPTATIVVSDNSLIAGETSLVTVTFSEAVTGFTNADLTIANGTLSAVSSSDGGVTWTATFTPTANISDATNLITLANTGVTDAAGNAGSGTTNSNNYAIDTARPTATIVVSDNSLRIGETSLVTFTFSEAVTGFTNADLTIANGTLSTVSSSDGGVTWMATFTPTANISDATNLITLANTGVTDAAGNAGSGTTNSNNYAIDTARPTATIVVSDNSLRIGETSMVTFTFSEAVTGFTNADLAMANGTLSGLSSSDGGVTWTATLTPTANISDATNVITLDNTGVTDAAGNAGSGTTNSNNYAIDTARPTVAISSSVGVSGSVTATTPIPFTITFSESVINFISGDITVGNGIVTNFSGSGATYNITVAPTAVGNVTINIAANKADDAAGNSNIAAAEFIINYQSVLPVNLISFNAKLDGNAAKLAWVTASESENNSFSILRSVNQTDFVQIGTVLGNGTTTTKNNYFFYDRQPLQGVNYYKLEQIDHNGTVKELGIKAIEFKISAKSKLSIVPNPAVAVTRVIFPVGTTKIELVDILGKLIKTLNVSLLETEQTFTIIGLPVATYVVRSYGNYGLLSAKLIKVD